MALFHPVTYAAMRPASRRKLLSDVEGLILRKRMADKVLVNDDIQNTLCTLFSN